jgi:hypothetical protein
MGRYGVLSAVAAHVAAGDASSLEAVVTPARRQPAPPDTLLPSDEELKCINEAGDPTAFRALTPEQRFEFDVRGYIVLRGHYSAEQVAEFNAGIDEVQALPKTHANFTRIGPLWDIPKDRSAMDDPTHVHWTGRTIAEDAAERKTSSMSMLLAGSDKFDSIVRDPLMREIHRELAGGACMLSGARVELLVVELLVRGSAALPCNTLVDYQRSVAGNYYIEKFGPCPGGTMHHGGFPRMRTFHCKHASVGKA